MKITIEAEKLVVSDGYHTIDELYDHRIRLYIALARKLINLYEVWCSDLHSDGSKIDGWFLLGINTIKGKQITYHLPMSYWSEVSSFAKYLNQAPYFDGHTSEDVLERLKYL